MAFVRRGSAIYTPKGMVCPNCGCGVWTVSLDEGLTGEATPMESVRHADAVRCMMCGEIYGAEVEYQEPMDTG